MNKDKRKQLSKVLVFVSFRELRVQIKKTIYRLELLRQQNCER